MYRAAAFGIRGSKWHGVRSRICNIDVRSVSSGLTDPGLNELHPSPAPEVVTPRPLSDPLETKSSTLRNGRNFPSESGASFDHATIDLEARGLQILGQSSSLSTHWIKQSAITEETGHRGLTFGVSTANMSERNNTIFQRRFSTHEEKVPVIRQLIFLDDYELKNAQLMSLRKCLFEKEIVKPISPDGLFQEDDLIRFCNLVLGDLGLELLRQLSALATVNLMRGLNISELIQLDNILWSPLYKGIVLEKSSLTVDTESAGCPYDAVRKVFNECLEISTRIKAENVRLPPQVSHYLRYLKDAKLVDKRLITNHSATRYPGERIQRNSRMNQLLCQEIPKRILKESKDKNLLQISTRANNVFTDLAYVFPWNLLMQPGLHKMVDYWAREGQRMRGIKAGLSPIVLPNSPIEELRAGTVTGPIQLMEALIEDPSAPVELGKILVALHRDPFEHLYEPLKEGVWQRSYNVLHVEQLLNGVNPLFGTKAEESFMTCGFWHMWEVYPDPKPLYLSWTDINWAPVDSEES